MKNTTARKNNFWIPLLLSLFFVCSCATIPGTKNAAHWLYILPKNASYYVCLNTWNTRDMIKGIIKEMPWYSNEADQLIDLTEKIFLGVKVEPGKKPAIFLILLGRYPLFINAMFGWSEDWEEVKGEIPFWRNKKEGLQAAAPESYIIIIAQDNLVELIRSFRAGGTAGLSRSAIDEINANDFTLLFPVGLDDVISGDLGIGKRKIFDEIWLGGRERDGKFYISGVFNVAPDVDAHAMKKLLQFIIFALLRRAEIDEAGKRLKDISIVTDRQMVKVSNFYLTKREFESFASSILSKGLQ